MDPTKEYDEFLKRVKRTIYLDNISPATTESVLKAAFNQFGNVTRVEFISDLMQPNGYPQAVLVEMENEDQTKQVVTEMHIFPFMIGGMPRPVRAKSATLEMFDDRPSKPGRKIQCRWLNPEEPDFEVSMKIKNLVKKHAAEASFLLEQQLAEEEKLSTKQDEALGLLSQKLKLLDGVCADGSVKQLAEYYRCYI
ncbi:hypothetical protein ACS0TY_016203 [Phlomoides rotata]